MEFILSIREEDEEEMISLEFICEEIKEKLKLLLVLIERYKQEKPLLKQQQFKAKKQLLFQIVHDESNHLVVTLSTLYFYVVTYVN